MVGLYIGFYKIIRLSRNSRQFTGLGVIIVMVIIVYIFDALGKRCIDLCGGVVRILHNTIEV